MTERTVDRDALPPGTRLEDFEIDGVIGHGGFGITYRGWNIGNRRPVAIKEYMPAAVAIRDRDWSVLPRTRDDEKDYWWGLDRFLDEARKLVCFDHPGIVRVEKYFNALGTAYMAMEYLEGRSLASLCREAEILNEPRLRSILTPVLDALEQVHDAGFLHRDIKPGNIVFRGDNTTPVLIDFGAARAAIARRSRSVTAIVTPGYSPIEQYSTGGEDTQGPCTDIYALGAVLYRGMTGRPPDDATDRSMDDRLQPTAEAVRGRYSRSLVDAVDWSLRMRAGDRPQSVREWREALDAGRRSSRTADADARTVAAEPRASGARDGGEPGRKRSRLVPLLVAALLAAGGIAYWLAAMDTAYR